MSLCVYEFMKLFFRYSVFSLFVLLSVTEAFGEVRLLPSRFRDNMQRDSAWMCSIPVDRLLHSFRNTAGCWTSKEGGYMSMSKLGGWESLDCDLRGHTTGHLLSAFAYMYDYTGNEIFKLKGDSLVQGLKEVQQIYGNGYLSAFGEGLIKRNIEGKAVWAPWYTLHKLLAGLICQYTLTDNKDALSVLEGMTNWAYNTLKPLDEETREKMLRNEFGGINESWYQISQLSTSASDKAKWLAEFFYDNRKLDPLKEGNFNMGTLHTNTFIPKVIGVATQGYQKWIEDWFWEINRKHTFCTGSLSQKEHFFPPEKMDQYLNGYTGETCCTYNMLRLMKQLWNWNHDAAIMDEYERALVNHILGQQDTETGMVHYFLPLLNGAYKLYSTYDKSFWCCVGSGFENHARYGEMIYGTSNTGDTLFVNLFIASELKTERHGVRQETRFPYEQQTKITILKPGHFTLAVRQPSWTAKNGISSYKCITKKWKKGETLTFNMPMSYRLQYANNSQTRAAVMYGPMVMAKIVGDVKKGEDFSDPMKYNDYYSYDFHVPTDLDATLQQTKAFYKTLTPLFDIHHKRYVVYFDVK